MEIRKVKIGDAEDLLVLLSKLDRETQFMLYEPGERQITIEQEEETIKQFVDSESQAMFIASDAGRLIGFIGGIGGKVSRNRHSIHFAMGVLLPFWGKTSGSQLLNSMESWAKNNKFHRLELTVMKNNQRAIAFYERAGFECEGTKRDSLKVNGKYIDELYMGKLI